MMKVIKYSEALRSVYLGRCSGCLEMLRTTSDDLFRFMGSRDFSALIILSAVACLESFLRDRLGRTVFSSASREVDHYIYEYIRTYNYLHPKPEDKLTKVSRGETLTEEQRKAIGESLKTINYHQTNKLNDRFFEKIFKTSIIVEGISDRIDEIIELRNYLSHNGGVLASMKINKEVDVSKASCVIDIIGEYITIVEGRFLKNGFVSVMDEIVLSALGIEEIDLIEKEKPGAKAPGK